MPGFAFPCGAAPRFDSSHLAAAGTMFSGVSASGGSFLNLLNGEVGVKSGSPTTAIMSIIGPALYNPNNDNVSFSGYPVISSASQTMAAIYQPDAASSTNSRQIINNTASSTTGMSLFAGPSGVWQASFGTAVINLPTPPVVSAGVPYFYAASFSSGLGVLNYIVVRLDTGQSWSGSVTQASSVVAGDTTFYIANRGLNTRQAIGKVAAGMHSTQFTSIAVFQAWGADPLAFWYSK